MRRPAINLPSNGLAGATTAIGADHANPSMLLLISVIMPLSPSLRIAPLYATQIRPFSPTATRV